MPTIVGEIRFPRLRRPLGGVTAYVRVEDVSRADAVAGVVAERVLRDVRVAPGDVVGFSLTAPTFRAGVRYGVRVHVDVDRDGSVSRGDYVSTQSYPLAGEGTARMTIDVHEVE